MKWTVLSETVIRYIHVLLGFFPTHYVQQLPLAYILFVFTFEPLSYTIICYYCTQVRLHLVPKELQDYNKTFRFQSIMYLLCHFKTFWLLFFNLKKCHSCHIYLKFLSVMCTEYYLCSMLMIGEISVLKGSMLGRWLR